MNEWTLHIRNQLGEIGRVNRAFNAWAHRQALSKDVQQRFNLVFDELVCNIITYGYPQGGEHEIEIRADYQPPRVQVQICDDGIPFNPFAEAPPPDTGLPLAERPIGGLGVHLVRNLMDETQYARQDGRNIVTLVLFYPANHQPSA